MAVTLTSGASALGVGNSTYFLGHGGTEPYIYSVVPGGAGGTIDADTGLYTAPAAATGTDTIQATDSAMSPLSGTRDILVGTPLELFCDVLRHELELDDDQIWLWDQKIDVPNDSRLYVVVGVLSSKPFGVTTKMNSSGIAVQSVNMLETVSVDLCSRSTTALLRKEEVIMAFSSIYAEQQQEANGFYIAPLPVGFVNLSQIDGMAIPYRFSISVNLQYCRKKSKAVPYYNDFEQSEVITDP